MGRLLPSVVLTALVAFVGCAKGSSSSTGHPGPDPASAGGDGGPVTPPGGGAPDLSMSSTGPTVDLAGGDAASFAQRCFPSVFVGHPDYDQFHPKYPATHCSGTNNPDITGVQMVVFLGDSITVGTPPTATADFYRDRLATTLATKFSLLAPNSVWGGVDLSNGVSPVKTSGDFSSCSKWGAKMVDLYGPSGKDQIDQCFAAVEPLKTLVIMTMGGNDFSVYAKQGMGGTAKATILAEVDTAIGYLSAALDQLKSPTRFPNGSYTILTDVYEFTDATGDEKSCPTAGVAGFSSMWADGPAVFAYLNEQIMKAAVAHGVDVVFLEEQFCGHGFKASDPTSPCYRGPGAVNWFDPLTCVHPDTAGHQALAGLFSDVVNE
jgi:lysophospholipase L1-like esterase